MPDALRIRTDSVEWIDSVCRKHTQSSETRAILTFEEGERITLTPFLNCGTTVGLIIEVAGVDAVNLVSAAGSFVQDPITNRWLSVLAAPINLSAASVYAALTEMLSTNFGVQLEAADTVQYSFKAVKPSVTRTLLENVIPEMQHYSTEGLPNIFLEDPQHKQTEGLIASLSGHLDLTEQQANLVLSLRQKIERFAHWYARPWQDNDLTLVVRLDNDAYIQFKQVEGHGHIYVESQSRAYKEESGIEVSEFHEAAANAIGWSHHQAVPNEFGIYEASSQTSVAALALHIVRSLTTLHGWNGDTPVLMEMFQAGYSWRELSKFEPWGELEDDDDEDVDDDDDEY